jgi:hypothetical protein
MVFTWDIYCSRESLFSWYTWLVSTGPYAEGGQWCGVESFHVLLVHVPAVSTYQVCLSRLIKKI